MNDDNDDVNAMTIVVRWIRIKTFLTVLWRTEEGIGGKHLVSLITLSERRGFVVPHSASTIRLELTRSASCPQRSAFRIGIERNVAQFLAWNAC